MRKFLKVSIVKLKLQKLKSLSFRSSVARDLLLSLFNFQSLEKHFCHVLPLTWKGFPVLQLYMSASHLLSKSQFLFIVRHKPWHFYYANITRWRTRVTAHSRAWLEEWKRGHSETSAFKPFFQLKLSRPKRQCQPNFFNISRFIAARHITRIVALCSGTLFWFLILKRRLFTHQRAPNEELRPREQQLHSV